MYNTSRRPSRVLIFWTNQIEFDVFLKALIIACPFFMHYIGGLRFVYSISYLCYKQKIFSTSYVFLLGMVTMYCTNHMISFISLMALLVRYAHGHVFFLFFVLCSFKDWLKVSQIFLNPIIVQILWLHYLLRPYFTLDLQHSYL